MTRAPVFAALACAALLAGCAPVPDGAVPVSQAARAGCTAALRAAGTPGPYTVRDVQVAVPYRLLVLSAGGTAWSCSVARDGQVSTLSRG